MRRRRGRMRIKRIRLHKSCDYSEYERRAVVLAELGFKDYAQYSRSKLWKGIHDAVIAEDPNCYGCGRPALQVHHTFYSRDVLSGKSRDGLYPICKRCHRWIEFTKDGYKRSPGHATAELEKVRKMRLLKLRWNTPE